MAVPSACGAAGRSMVWWDARSMTGNEKSTTRTHIRAYAHIYMQHLVHAVVGIISLLQTIGVLCLPIVSRLGEFVERGCCFLADACNALQAQRMIDA